MNKSVILLHGLNNHPEVLSPFKDFLEEKGFKTYVFNLYGHKKDSPLTHLTLKESLHHLHFQMLQIPKTDEVYFLGFSQGALIFQLYQMMKVCQHQIKAQVLLAPALYIKRQSFLAGLTSLFPETFRLPSRTPKEFRQFDKLNMGYYKQLVDQLNVFQKHGIHHLKTVPTLILSDAKDELVDMNRLHSEMLKNNLDLWKIVYVNRNLKHIKHYGKHHIMFNQNYFTEEDWGAMLGEIETMLAATT